MADANIWFAMGLAVLAGLSTGIGGLFVCLFRQVNAKVLSVALGFSAGVMIYVSFVEIFSESKEMLTAGLGYTAGSWANMLAFFSGMLLIAVIDNLVPAGENPHESRLVGEVENYCDLNHEGRLLRTGIFTALVIAIHNFPEGMATFISAMQEPSLGIAIALAIAIHNIPEGMAVAIPVYCATGSRKRALGLSFLSGLMEPAGAIITYILLMPFLNDTLFGILFAAVAGIMVFISLDELLPAAREYGEAHLSIYGLITGMAVMALSLLLFITK
jgi:ZIP family zinc transporter